MVNKDSDKLFPMATETLSDSILTALADNDYPRQLLWVFLKTDGMLVTTENYDGWPKEDIDAWNALMDIYEVDRVTCGEELDKALAAAKARIKALG